MIDDNTVPEVCDLVFSVDHFVVSPLADWALYIVSATKAKFVVAIHVAAPSVDSTTNDCQIFATLFLNGFFVAVLAGFGGKRDGDYFSRLEMFHRNRQ